MHKSTKQVDDEPREEEEVHVTKDSDYDQTITEEYEEHASHCVGHMVFLFFLPKL